MRFPKAKISDRIQLRPPDVEDLKTAQKDLREAKDLDDLKKVFKKWRKIGWKNVCKRWLEERTPEQLKGEGT